MAKGGGWTCTPDTDKAGKALVTGGICGVTVSCI